MRSRAQRGVNLWFCFVNRQTDTHSSCSVRMRSHSGHPKQLNELLTEYLDARIRLRRKYPLSGSEGLSNSLSKPSARRTSPTLKSCRQSRIKGKRPRKRSLRTGQSDGTTPCVRRWPELPPDARVHPTFQPPRTTPLNASTEGTDPNPTYHANAQLVTLSS
jgi:hypothetical protein